MASPPSSDRSAREDLVVGFDLDKTLIDFRPGVGAGYDLPARQTATAIRVRPGAREALAAVRQHRGRLVVVTAKHEPQAQLHIDHLGLDVDALHGGVWRAGKAAVLVAESATVFVGDHVDDVGAAHVAGAVSVGVTSGPCSREELLVAGADTVLSSLMAFPGWLDEHLLAIRLGRLDAQLRAAGSVLVAFSGGADSALLLAAAVRALGADRVVAATAYSASLPLSERGPAGDFCDRLGVRQVQPLTRELERAGYRANAGDRCYFCKSELLDVLGGLARELGLASVATGTNADDAVAGFRPGIRAAAERGALTPLRDAGLTKAQVREASRRWGLPTWDKPAAACLSSRIAYGIPVTSSRLARVERAESAVRQAAAAAGIALANVRVRDLGDRARVEVDAAAVAAVNAAATVLDAVRATGFTLVEIDPRGFRSGAMNELLAGPDRRRFGGQSALEPTGVSQ